MVYDMLVPKVEALGLGVEHGKERPSQISHLGAKKGCAQG